MLVDHRPRSGVPQDLQLRILSWATHSSRSLRLLELADMLDSVAEKKCKGTKAVVRNACCPLLEILEDETISVIHHSFTEFLTDSSRGQRPPPPDSTHSQFPLVISSSTHRILGLACLNYLSTSGCLAHALNENEKLNPRGPLTLQFPFLDYASRSWFEHCRKSGCQDTELFHVIDLFLAPERQFVSSWLRLEWQVRRRDKDGAIFPIQYTLLLSKSYKKKIASKL